MDLALLERILGTQSVTGDQRNMERLVVAYAKAHGATVAVEDGNVYVTKGQADSYPCVVAHLDTVHGLIPNKHFRLVRGVVPDMGDAYWGWNTKRKTFTGVGGDDKVGIFIALTALTELEAVKLAFFRDEEIGCRGSYTCRIDFFDDCTLVLENDRKGAGEFVSAIMGILLYGREFMDAVAPILERFDFREVEGGMTDVLALKEEGLRVACANISCGYYNPHKADEFVVIGDVERALNLTLAICEELGGTRWEHDADLYEGYDEDDSWGFDGKLGGAWCKYIEGEYDGIGAETLALLDAAVPCPKCGRLDQLEPENGLSGIDWWCWGCGMYVDEAAKAAEALAEMGAR